MSVKVHAIVRFYPFPTKINGGTSPVRVVVIDGNKDDVF